MCLSYVFFSSSLLCKLIADGVNVDICTENYTTLKDDDDERHEYNSLITSLLLNHTKSLECPYEVKKNRQKLIFSLNLTSRVVSHSLSLFNQLTSYNQYYRFKSKTLKNKKKTPVKWRENYLICEHFFFVLQLTRFAQMWLLYISRCVYTVHMMLHHLVHYASREVYCVYENFLNVYRSRGACSWRRKSC